MRRARLAAVMACLGLVACAPAPGVSAPMSSSASASDSPSASSPTTTPAAPTTSAEPTASTSTMSPTATDTPDATASPEASPAASAGASSAPATPAPEGWASLDARLISESDVGQFALVPKVASYLQGRLKEGCDLRITVFAAHPDGHFIADESGTCAGARLMVYGPEGGGIGELLEISSVPACTALTQAGVPAGVPATKLFPDGLACTDGGRIRKY